MRRGQAARVASLLYLTPVFAVVLERAMFDVVPSRLSIVGIAITLLGVALVAWRRKERRRRTQPASPPDDRSKQNRTRQPPAPTHPT